MSTRPLHFGFTYTPYSEPEARFDPFNPAQISTLAQSVEKAGFTFIRFQDKQASGEGPAAFARTEPFTTASFLATRTKRLGFFVTGNTSYFEPFNLARLTASLDHVTHGRAGWELVSGASYPAAINYSQAEPSAEEHYGRAAEAAEILSKLWDSWEDDAFIRNKATGDYVDGDKIHPIHHAGERFRIKGPLNVARPPQGQLVVAHEITSELSYPLAAAEADVVFLGAQPVEELKVRVAAFQAALDAAGRDRKEVRLFAEATVIVAASAAEAAALVEQSNPGGAAAPRFVGAPGEVAEQLAAYADAAGLDGLTLRAAGLPGQLDALIELLAPELQRLGLLSAPKEGGTLRDHLALDKPANRYAAA
jgi:alkanesulfonate monooxygenase SsuD/methylene tetrahydromethanopterin reductase-like flavin-dependent oxidoreductase (luciferase family)